MLVLGSTGSIGTQALEVIAANPDRFEVVGLAAGGGNPDLLARQRSETGVTNIAVADPGAAEQVGDVTYAGPQAATSLVENTEADVVLNALVGALGLQPTLAALASGARLALANKESLIAGGPLVLQGREAGPDRARRLRAFGDSRNVCAAAPPTRSPAWCSPRPAGRSGAGPPPTSSTSRPSRPERIRPGQWAR